LRPKQIELIVNKKEEISVAQNLVSSTSTSSTQVESLLRKCTRNTEHDLDDSITQFGRSVR